MTLQEFAELVTAGESQQSTETAAFVEFIPILLPLLLNLPCLRNKTAEEQHEWIKKHPGRSVAAASQQLRKKDPSLTKREANRRARRLWEEQSKLTAEQASQLAQSL